MILHSQRRQLAGSKSGTTQGLYRRAGGAAPTTFSPSESAAASSTRPTTAPLAGSRIRGTTAVFKGVWGSGPNDIFAVAFQGVIVHSSNAAPWQAQIGDYRALQPRVGQRFQRRLRRGHRRRDSALQHVDYPAVGNHARPRRRQGAAAPTTSSPWATNGVIQHSANDGGQLAGPDLGDRGIPLRRVGQRRQRRLRRGRQRRDRAFRQRRRQLAGPDLWDRAKPLPRVAERAKRRFRRGMSTA